MRELSEQLTGYLRDAHAIEEQSLRQLRAAPAVAGHRRLEAALRAHLPETEAHERRMGELLEHRGERPSLVKDVVMGAGGGAFVLFARLQPDTPGKLVAHAYAYEALEKASYELLALTADHAGEEKVAEAARRIRDEEQAMMERLAGLFDDTAAAALEGLDEEQRRGRLAAFLADAHALEAQSIQLLGAGRRLFADRPIFAELLEQHLEESKAQQRAVEERLEALDAKRSLLKDAALRLGALEWGTFFAVQPDTPGKLTAFAYAFEHLEIAGYEQLHHVAGQVGDHDSTATAARIARQESAFAAKLAGAFPAAVGASLAELGVG